LAAGGVIAKQRLELLKQIALGAKVAEVPVAAGFFLGHALLHGLALKAVEAVALDHGGLDALAPKDILKGALTVEVPAPDEPVMAMMGWRSDMAKVSWIVFG